MTAVVVLIHEHVYPTVTMVQVDTVFHRGSHSAFKSPRHFDRGYLPEIDYSHGRDYSFHSLDRNNNYRDRQYSPSFYGRRYNNPNGFSLVRSYSQDHCPNQYQNRQFQGRYQGGN